MYKESVCKQKVTHAARHTWVNPGREHTEALGYIFATYLEIQNPIRIKKSLRMYSTDCDLKNRWLEEQKGAASDLAWT